MSKKLIIIYVLIFLAGLIIGWFLVAFNNYEQLRKNNPAPSFWQVASPF